MRAREITLCLLLALSAGCAREDHSSADIAALSTPARSEHAAPLHAAALEPAGTRHSRPSFGVYDDNAWAVSEGKRYFSWFNCNGCHAQGGGSFGPALMDDNWRYGSAPNQIYASIVDGRAGGMPSFAGKLTEQQVWRLVAYVHALGGLLRFDVLPGRSEGLNGHDSEFMMHHAASDLLHSPIPSSPPGPVKTAPGAIRHERSGAVMQGSRP